MVFLETLSKIKIRKINDKSGESPNALNSPLLDGIARTCDSSNTEIDASKELVKF